MTSAATNRRNRTGPIGRFSAWVERVETPLSTYYVLLGVTWVLVAIGLVMVLSASSVVSYEETNSSYTIFLSQLQFAVIGGVVMLIASRVPVAVWRRLAIPAIAGAIALQSLVLTPLGETVNGNTNWIRVGPLTMQPSELTKIGIVLFGAAVLARKRKLLDRVGHVLVPFLVPVTGAAVTLVLLGNDLGTVLVLAALVGGLLYAAGVPQRLFVMAFVGFAGVAAYFMLTSANRMERINVWLDPLQCQPGDEVKYYGICRQPMHGMYALADGGWWGLGLGGSREKWSWLPEPHNDFIFAIIGEELGLPGTLSILLLYALFAFACYRLVVRSEDLFVRLATAGVMSWVVAQALINIGAVIGLLPIIGVPLPLVSSGGSSLVTTMLALGMLVAFARQEPSCAQALATRPRVVRRSLAVLPSWRKARP